MLVADVGVPERTGGVEADAVGVVAGRRGPGARLAERAVGGDGYAVSFSPYDSATTSVEPSGLMAMPFGNASPSATTRTEPSASTRTTDPGRNSPPGNSKPMVFT